MSTPFQTISQFLEYFSHDVEGRSARVLPEELAHKLREFACGRASGAQRDEVCLLLKENPHWVSELAREAKSLRDQPRDQSL